MVYMRENAKVYVVYRMCWLQTLDTGRLCGVCACKLRRIQISCGYVPDLWDCGVNYVFRIVIKCVGGGVCRGIA